MSTGPASIRLPLAHRVARRLAAGGLVGACGIRANHKAAKAAKAAKKKKNASLEAAYPASQKQTPSPPYPDWASFHKKNPSYVSSKERPDGRDRRRLAHSPGMFGY